MNSKRSNKTPASQTPRAPRKRSWSARFSALMKPIGVFLTSRSRDLALVAIVLGAFVAVFDGSLYSARTFGFHGWSAYAFAVMPDALMVLSAAKMRQTGIAKAQWETAHKWMNIALRFSLLTNMIAAFLRNAPAHWITPLMILIGAIAYHGMIVIFLKGAVDVLTRVRADRKDAAVKVATEPVAAPEPARSPAVTPAWRDWTDTVLALVPRKA